MNATDKQTAENGKDARDQKGRFTGNTAGPGRPKGSRNQLSGAIKEDVLAAYERRGGLKWLSSLPDKEFLPLLEKVLSKDLAAELKLKPEDGNMSIKVNIVTFGSPEHGQVLREDLAQKQLSAEAP